MPVKALTHAGNATALEVELPTASEIQDGVLAAGDFAAFDDMRLPPDGKTNRQWVPNANVNTFDDRGWGAATWGTLTGQPIQNVAATRFARIRFATGATANSGAGVGGAQAAQRSGVTTARIGGFRYTARFRLQQIAATNQWFFVGLTAAGGAWTGATLPTAIPNCMGFFLRNNVLQALTVSAAGVASAVASSFPVASLTNGAEVFIDGPELVTATTAMTYGIRAIDTDPWTTGTFAPATGIQPGVPFGPMVAMSASSTLVAVLAEIGVQTLQTRY